MPLWLGGKVCKDPPWSPPDFAEQMDFSLGTHPLPACSQPPALHCSAHWDVLGLCLVGEDTDGLPPSALAAKAGPTGPFLGLHMQVGATLLFFPELMHSSRDKGLLCKVHVSRKGQASTTHLIFIIPPLLEISLQPMVEYIQLFP